MLEFLGNKFSKILEFITKRTHGNFSPKIVENRLWTIFLIKGLRADPPEEQRHEEFKYAALPKMIWPWKLPFPQNIPIADLWIFRERCQVYNCG